MKKNYLTLVFLFFSLISLCQESIQMSDQDSLNNKIEESQKKLHIILGVGPSIRLTSLNTEGIEGSYNGNSWTLTALYQFHPRINSGVFYSNYWSKAQSNSVYLQDQELGQLPIEFETPNNMGYISFITHYRSPSFYKDKLWLMLGASIGEINYTNKWETSSLVGHTIGYGLHGNFSFMIHKNIGIIVNAAVIFGKLKKAELHRGSEFITIDMQNTESGNVGRSEFGIGLIFSLFQK